MRQLQTPTAERHGDLTPPTPYPARAMRARAERPFPAGGAPLTAFELRTPQVAGILARGRYRVRSLVFALCVASLAAMPGSLRAQTAKVSQEQREANYRAHSGDFDYLLGDWEFTVVSKAYGASHGRWTAVRLAQGQLLDEFRVVDDKGQTLYVTTTLRAYNAVMDRWELVGMDSGNGLRDYARHGSAASPQPSRLTKKPRRSPPFR